MPLVWETSVALESVFAFSSLKNITTMQKYVNISYETTMTEELLYGELQ